MNIFSTEPRPRAGWILLLLATLAGCAPPKPREAQAPPPTAMREVVVTADRLASDAGLAMLKRGGAPIDAAVAAQAVLGLVEPQGSGPGGGSVLLTWQAAGGKLHVFDGTPRAGRNAAAGLNADARGLPLDPRSVMHGGGAVGVPGTLPVLWAAHKAQGKLAWADLFAPAIGLAEGGFPLSRGLHDLLAASGAGGDSGAVAAMYGSPLPAAGSTVRNPAYAATLRRVARLGPEGLWSDGALPELLAALDRGAQPSRLTAADFHDYAATEPEPLCANWLQWRICTAPPPTFGGLAMLQMLAMAGPGDLSDPGYAHRFLEAGRLAQADRRRYAADPEQVPVPAKALLDPAYLASRAALIAPSGAMSRPRAGDVAAGEQSRRDDPAAPTTATSQIVVVARNGDALTMTSTLTHNFGARVWFGGLQWNNALVNFAPLPPSGVRYANQMAPNKRPATPLAPVIAFDTAGTPVLLGGSGGGPGTPDFVAAALVDLLAGQRPPAEALARPHLSSADLEHVAVEAGTAAEQLAPALRAMGHAVSVEPLPSGSAFVLRSPQGWRGAADPRHEGVALGD